MIIKTKRLELRPINESYLDYIMKSLTDEVAVYMFIKTPITIEEGKQVINSFIVKREKGLDYVYAIVLKETDEFIGMCGLHKLISNKPELSIWTKIEAHGNHYGREAIGGLIEHAKEAGYKKLVYPVDKRNPASRKIPEYFGGITVEEKTVTENGKTLFEVIYEIEI